MSDALKEKLSSEVDLTTWQDLRYHAAKDHLFLVHESLSLVEAGLAIAEDRKAEVQRYLERGQLGRPNRVQLEQWESQLGKTFRCLIIAPFVLATEVEVVSN